MIISPKEPSRTRGESCLHLHNIRVDWVSLNETVQTNITRFFSFRPTVWAVLSFTLSLLPFYGSSSRTFMLLWLVYHHPIGSELNSFKTSINARLVQQPDSSSEACDFWTALQVKSFTKDILITSWGSSLPALEKERKEIATNSSICWPKRINSSGLTNMID